MSHEGLSLPQASMTRLIKGILPESLMIHADAKATAIKSTSLFMMYLADAANDIRKQTKRSTVTSEDIISALKDIDFDCLVEPATTYCQLQRQHSKEKRDAMKARKVARPSGGAGGAGGGDGDGDGDEDDGAGGDVECEDGEASVKRSRGAAGGNDDGDDNGGDEDDADVTLSAPNN